MDTWRTIAEAHNSHGTMPQNHGRQQCERQKQRNIMKHPHLNFKCVFDGFLEIVMKNRLCAKANRSLQLSCTLSFMISFYALLAPWKPVATSDIQRARLKTVAHTHAHVSDCGMHQLRWRAKASNNNWMFQRGWRQNSLDCSSRVKNRLNLK